MINERQLKSLENAVSLPQRVRESAEFVVTHADFVKIRTDDIEAYTKRLLQRYPIITSLDAQSHFLSEASPAATAAFVLALDSVNFGSGYFRAAAETGVALEYAIIAGGLRKAFGQSRMNTPYKWLAATAEDCHEIFGVPAGKHRQLDRLMGLFADHLGASGQQIVENYDGEVMNLLEAAGNSAVSLVNIVASWPTFHDKTVYKGAPVSFFKRAQIFAADMHLALQGQAPAAFADMGALTCFADNMVPHVLRYDSILDYAPQLAARIDNAVQLPEGAPEEIEIRACGIHAVELMKQAAVELGHDVTSVNLDHIIWNRGYEREIYEKPSHKTLTVWY